MKTPLLPDEEILREGRANLQRGIETVGGMLYLTDRRLVFESHVFNIKHYFTVLPLTEVTDVQKCWTKFLNLVPIFPNSMAVSTKDGKTYRFVVFDREGWIADIEQELE